MKRLFVGIVFVLALVSVLSVSAQYDLSGFSYTDLQNIVAQAQKEMMTRPEFQSVEVPVGLYVVGREIPAGTWTLSRTGTRNPSVTTGTELSNQNEIMINLAYYSVWLNDDAPVQNITLEEGKYVQVERAAVVFSTPTGVSFSFK